MQSAMTVFISHAPQDRDVAEALGKTLERRGNFVEFEDGETPMRPLQAMDAAVVLISKDFVFSPWRLRFEQRALEAWAEGKLIVVKLDHNFAPVGLRDLPFIDASFEARRDFTWQDVAKDVQEKLRPAAQSQSQDAPPAPAGPAPASKAPPRADRRRPVAKRKAKKSGGGLFGGLFKRKAEPEAAADEEAGAAPAIEPVFVSYARANAPIVMPVIKEVEKSRKVWLDQAEIGGGDGWAGEIVRAIRTADGVLVMCSSAAFESDHVKREVYLADRYKKRMVPVFIEDAQPPEDFEYFFAGVQWLKLHETPEAERPAAVLRALGSA